MKTGRIIGHHGLRRCCAMTGLGLALGLGIAVAA